MGKKREVAENQEPLEAYKPIIKLLASQNTKGGKNKKTNLNNCILSILPEAGHNVLSECINNALYSKLLKKEDLSRLSKVRDQKSIRRLGEGQGDVESRRRLAIAHSEDVGNTLSSILPNLTRLLLIKKKLEARKRERQAEDKPARKFPSIGSLLGGRLFKVLTGKGGKKRVVIVRKKKRKPRRKKKKNKPKTPPSPSIGPGPGALFAEASL